MVPIISSLIILFVNVLTTDFISKHKYHRMITYTIILIFTASVLSIHLLLSSWLGFTDQYHLMYIIYVWSYLIIFIPLYKHKITTLIMIMSLSLTHSVFVNGVVYHFNMILNGDFQRTSFILGQIFVFAITTPLIIIVMKKTIKNVIETLNQQLIFITVLLPLTNFFIIYLMRFYIDFNSMIIFLIAYLLICALILLSYYIIYKIVSDSLNIHRLSSIAYTDGLTKLSNRMALYYDFDQYVIKDIKQFTLFYLDLNKLKSINDQYGHLEGDEYIIQFSKAVQSSIRRPDTLYRISGDEFIIISHKNQLNISYLKQKIQEQFLYTHPFLGVSIGQASYPLDAQTIDGLLNLADKKMYEDKSS